jgi:hypothetical protein
MISAGDGLISPVMMLCGTLLPFWCSISVRTLAR